MSKINVSHIISDHFGTLRNERTGKPSFGDLFIFFMIPLIVTIALVSFDIAITESIVNVLLTSLSVFAALLFNLLLLVFDIVKRPEAAKGGMKHHFLEEIYANISFSILVAIMDIVFLLVEMFAVKQVKSLVILNLLDFFVFLFTGVFVLTLLMILKRIHALFTREIQDGAS